MKFISSIFIMLTLFSCLSKKEKLIHITGKTMGTYYSVKVVGSNIVVEELKIQVDGLLKEVNNRVTFIYLRDLNP